MPPPTPPDALVAMFRGGETQLDVEGGEPLPVRLTRIEDDTAWGLAPRLRVAAGHRLSGRANTDDGDSWLVFLAIETAEYASAELASIALRVTAVEPHPHRRRVARIPAGGAVWLEALSCQEVVDGDRVDGVMTDLSPLGVAFTTMRLLRTGDQLQFHGRVFQHPLDCTVRVASVRMTADGRRLAGCAFLDMAPADIDVLERIGRGERVTPAPQLDLQSLRESAEAPSGGLLGRFRRGS